MPKRSDMTERVYEYLQKAIKEQGYAPSVREICEAVGLKSPSTAHFHLKRLQERGLIEKGDCKGRAIVLKDQRDRDRIPIVGCVAAGSPILAEESIEDYLAFDCQGREEEYFALRVRGESMRGVNGESVVALLGEEATVKRYSKRGDKIWLLPENDAYSPIDGTEAQLLGKVAAVVRRYD